MREHFIDAVLGVSVLLVTALTSNHVYGLEARVDRGPDGADRDVLGLLRLELAAGQLRPGRLPLEAVLGDRGDLVEVRRVGDTEAVGGTVALSRV